MKIHKSNNSLENQSGDSKQKPEQGDNHHHNGNIYKHFPHKNNTQKLIAYIINKHSCPESPAS